MTREEEIKQAVENNLDVSVYTPQDGEMLKETFYIGAKWADANPKQGLVDLSKFWHNASIEPERDAFFIAEDNKGDLDAYCWTKRDDDWIEYACLFGLRRWAYMKDLLPKGGEQ